MLLLCMPRLFFPVCIRPALFRRMASSGLRGLFSRCENKNNGAFKTGILGLQGIGFSDFYPIYPGVTGIGSHLSPISSSSKEPLNFMARQ